MTRILGCSEAEFSLFLEEAKALRFCYAVTGDNGEVTLRNRRMFEEQKSRDNNALRQARHRDKKRSNSGSNEKVTAHSSSSISSSSKQKKILKEKSTPKPPRKSQKKASTPAPEFYPVSDAMKSYADSKGYVADLDDLTEAFLIYHRKKGSMFVDWYAAWQTWLRNQLEWYPEKNVPKGEPVRKSIEPKTYAQALDVERRDQARMVLEMKRRRKEQNEQRLGFGEADGVEHNVQPKKVGR